MMLQMKLDSYNRLKATRIFVAFVFFASSLFGLNAFAEQSKTPKEKSVAIVIALENEHGGPALDLGNQEEFDCNDKIFTVVELSNYPKKEFQLSVKWINPEGDVQECKSA